MLENMRCGMVATRGESAHGFGAARSCSRVWSMILWYLFNVETVGEMGHTHFMNLRAREEPHGSLSGRSKVLPNRTSSAVHGVKNRPVDGEQRVASASVTRLVLNTKIERGEVVRA